MAFDHAHRSADQSVVAAHSALQRIVFPATAFVLVASLMFGGGTRAGFLSDIILQVLAVPLLLLAFWVRLDLRPKRQLVVMVFCGALLAIFIAQLIPLAPAVWTALPNRGQTVKALELAGQALPWLPVSVSPQMTTLAAFSIVLPIAVAMATSVLGYADRRRLCLLVLAVGLLGMVIGLLQTAQGQGSPLYFYATTNVGVAVGFLANRNHHAAVMYVTLMFAIAWMLWARSVVNNADEGMSRKGEMLLLGAGIFLCLALVVGALLARSRTGILLTMVAMVAGFLMFLGNRAPVTGLPGTSRKVRYLAIAGFIALQFALLRLLERLIQDPRSDPRVRFFHNTWDAMMAYLPFGSGIGTFVPVYARSERVQDISSEYANRAHNDVLEFALEAGVAGVALMAGFVVWLAVRGIVVWRDKSDHGLGIDGLLARAAVVAVALLIAHSFLDYPLRTGALMALMAFSCALLVPAPDGIEASKSGGSTWLAKALSRTNGKGTGGKRGRGNAKGSAKTTGRSAPRAAATGTGPGPRQSPTPVPMPRPLPPTGAPATAGFPPGTDVPPAVTPATAQSPEKGWGDGVAWPEAWRASAGTKPVDGKEPR